MNFKTQNVSVQDTLLLNKRYNAYLSKVVALQPHSAVHKQVIKTHCAMQLT